MIHFLSPYLCFLYKMYFELTDPAAPKEFVGHGGIFLLFQEPMTYVGSLQGTRVTVLIHV